MSPDFNHIAIIGAGAWGTALATAASRAGRQVTLYARDSALAAEIMRSRINTQYLPEIPLPDDIRICADSAGLAKADLLLVATPAQYLRENLRRLASLPRLPVVICAKGIERDTLALMPEVAAETLPDFPLALLSGPNFAREVAQALPTTATIAAVSLPLAEAIQHALASRAFRPYASTDPVGVAVGGAIKNVLAIACGIAIGLGLGENARAALLTRGFAEMTRLALALGGAPETLIGSSGLGDLVLTATSLTSRNYALGITLGQGMDLAQLSSRTQRHVIEGVTTAAAAAMRARRHEVDMPVTQTVAAILEQRETIAEAIDRLLDRPLRTE